MAGRVESEIEATLRAKMEPLLAWRTGSTSAHPLEMPSEPRPRPVLVRRPVVRVNLQELPSPWITGGSESSVSSSARRCGQLR